MRAAKHILFVAGLVGLVGLFVPLVSLGKNLTHVEVSARDLSFGLERTHKVIDARIPPVVAKRMPRDVITGREDVRTVLKALRGAAAAFIPSALLLAFGVAGMWRGRSGRGLAAAALVCGVASIAAYLGLRYGIDYGYNEEPLLKRVDLTIELGAYLLIVAGIGGIAGGLLGIIKPEEPRRRVVAPHFPPPPVPPPA
ncbi:MAG TPA: hypothetical protein VK427_23510 [Kofleriaceae bacterium]|nr:hypothetical protein [Kofleriaceae bacterium]